MIRIIAFGMILISFQLFGQAEKPVRWELSTNLTFASENNLGSKGLILANELDYFLTPQVSLSAHSGFFRSFPWFPDYRPGDFFIISSFITGLRINHTIRFNNDRNFVKVSGGIDYFNTYEAIFQDFNAQQQAYQYTKLERVSDIGYDLSLEGGGQLSDKISLGLCLQIYSYQIFGDIITLGPKVHIKL